MIHPRDKRHFTQVRTETRRRDPVPTSLLWRLRDIEELDRAAVIDP
jgi:hypothetical protein